MNFSSKRTRSCALKRNLNRKWINRKYNYRRFKSEGGGMLFISTNTNQLACRFKRHFNCILQIISYRLEYYTTNLSFMHVGSRPMAYFSFFLPPVLEECRVENYGKLKISIGEPENLRTPSCHVARLAASDCVTLLYANPAEPTRYFYFGGTRS